MRLQLTRAGLALGAFAAVALFVAGCSDKGGTGGDAKDKGKDKPVAQAGKDDSGSWWCKEHGIPEHDCAQCDAKVAAEYKKKGDWCKEHGRPESQCFICNPKRAEKFAAEYRAKYGKEPPPRDDEKGEKAEKKEDGKTGGKE